jgi:hypothetical protein
VSRHRKRPLPCPRNARQGEWVERAETVPRERDGNKHQQDGEHPVQGGGAHLGGPGGAAQAPRRLPASGLTTTNQ